MMRAQKVTLIIPLLLVICLCNTFAQHIFPEQFEGCETNQFVLERDSVSVQLDDSELLRVITGKLPDKTRDKLKGTLSLQIIVDYYGNSCLLSIKNDTNVRSKKLMLKQSIDEDLKWSIPERRVSAIIILSFEENDVQVVRLGIDADRGVHRLKD